MNPEIEAVATPEMRLLCAVARLEMDEVSATRLDRALSFEIDWGRLRPLAEFHGLRPLLYRHVKAADDPRVPAEAKAWMEFDAKAIAAKNLSLARTLASIASSARAAGCPVLAFKGPVTALRVYENLGAREFGDLDLLINPEDYRAARDVLQRLGFRSMLGRSAEEERALHDTHGVVEFRHRESREAVELHWRLLPRHYRAPVSPSEVFETSISLSIAGESVRALNPSLDLTHSVLHGAKHAWGALEWLCAVAIRLEGDARAPQIHQTRGAGRAVGLASELSGLLLGRNVIRDVAIDDWSRRQALQLARGLALERDGLHRHRSLSDHGFFARSAGTSFDAVRYVWHAVFGLTPNDASALTSRTTGRWFARIGRPLRLASASARRVLGRTESKMGALE